MKYLLLFTTLIFSAEMEVDGNLKVTGTIQNDSLAQVILLQQQQINSLLLLIADLEFRIANMECLNTGISPEGYCDCYGNALDLCGVCAGDDMTCTDCANVLNGDSTEDNCGNCDNDSSNDCLQDCFGEWGGAAEYDACGECGGDIQNEDECPVYDQDGNAYHIIQIGDQIWMRENIRTSANRLCYDDDPENCEIYGGLYEWESAQNACPAGWHVASEGEYITLYSNYDGQESAGIKLKDNELWNGTNESGFSALPGGYYHPQHEPGYSSMGSASIFWTSTYQMNGNTTVGKDVIFYSDHSIAHSWRSGSEQLIHYMSVRCIQN